jgi:hypothetical protein
VEAVEPQNVQLLQRLPKPKQSELLQEYRIMLFSGAVTGKIAVRGMIETEKIAVAGRI